MGNGTSAASREEGTTVSTQRHLHDGHQAKLPAIRAPYHVPPLAERLRTEAGSPSFGSLSSPLGASQGEGGGAMSPQLLARKYSLTSFKTATASCGRGSPVFGSPHSMASSPTHHQNRSVSFETPNTDSAGAAVANTKSTTPIASASPFSFLGSLFGSFTKGGNPASPSLPPLSPSPTRHKNATRKQDDDIATDHSPGKKDFRRWVAGLSGPILWGFESGGGEGLLQAVKKQLTKRVTEEFVFRHNLTRHEAAAMAIFTARTGIRDSMRELILHHMDAPGHTMTDSELSMPALQDNALPESAFLIPLLSALPKLPRLVAQDPRDPPAMVLFSTVDIAAMQRHDDLNANIAIPTVLSVATLPSEAVCNALGGPSHCRILCIKATTARRIGPLNMSVDPPTTIAAEDAAMVEGQGMEEGLLLPGWHGRIVGTVHQRWKKMLSHAVGWDVSAYTLMEVVEVEDPSASDATVAAPSPTSAAAGAASLWKRRVRRRSNEPLHESPEIAPTVLTTAMPKIAPEPFMAKEFLVAFAERVIARNPRDTTWNLYLGLLLVYATGAHAKAKRCFEAVLREKSADHAALLQLGLLNDRHLDDPAAARKMYEGALKTGTDNANLYQLLGSLLRRKFRDYGAAKRYLEAALKLDPRHVAAHAEYGWILENYVDDPGAAEEHYRAALRMEPNHAEANYFLAYSREVHHKDYKAARRYYTLCVAGDARHADGHYRLAKVLDEHYQQYEDAQLHYEAAIAVDPKHADAHHLLGFLLLMHRKDPKRALRQFQLAVEANPNHADALNHMGYVLWRSEGSWAQAAEAFRKAIAVDPQHCNAHSNLARGLLEVEKAVDAARTHFETATRLDPNDIYVRTSYATMLLDYFKDKRSEMQTALLHLEVVVVKNPCYAPGHMQLARALLLLQKSTRKAKTELELALELDSNFADAHNELGYLLESKFGEWTRAREHYQRAVDLDSGHATARNNLGLLLWKHLDDPLHARQHFETALSTDPTNLHVMKNLATLLLERFQDYKRARYRLECVLKLDPTDVSTLTLLASLLKNKFKEYPKAKSLLEAARRQAPKDVHILNELGLLYARPLRDSVMALELFEEVLGLEPNNGCARTNVDRIMNYSKRYQQRKQAREQQYRQTLVETETASYSSDRADDDALSACGSSVGSSSDLD